MKRAWLFLLAFSVVGCLPEAKPIERARIYYIPIGVETYVPITSENIEKAYVRIGDATLDNPTFKSLMKTINSAGAGPFEGDMLRAKILLSDGQIIYIDNHGGLNSPVSGIAKIPKSKLDKTQKLLESLTQPRSSR